MLLGDMLLDDIFLVVSYLQQFISSRAVQSSRSPCVCGLTPPEFDGCASKQANDNTCVVQL